MGICTGSETNSAPHKRAESWYYDFQTNLSIKRTTKSHNDSQFAQTQLLTLHSIDQLSNWLVQIFFSLKFRWMENCRTKRKSVGGWQWLGTFCEC